jgi:hypothetical protein
MEDVSFRKTFWVKKFNKLKNLMQFLRRQTKEPKRKRNKLEKILPYIIKFDFQSNLSTKQNIRKFSVMLYKGIERSTYGLSRICTSHLWGW